jgi:hypothetical protein
LTLLELTLETAIKEAGEFKDVRLLKEDAECILALLKEQEAVEPECQIIFDVPYYFCGNCKTMLNMYAVKAKYCSNCARRVKWG